MHDLKKKVRLPLWQLLIVAAFLSLLYSNCLAEEYVSLEMYPQHVGVFTTDGTQQFVAFGVTASGKRVNITRQVSWRSSDPSLVTIDANGLATIQAGKTSGQVKITCSYPGGSSLTAVIGSLLRPSFAVTSSVDGAADHGDISPEGETMVKRGNGLVLDLSPDSNVYEVVADNVGGTCPAGSVIANFTRYRSGSITEACTVIVPFSEKPEVSPSIDAAHNWGTMNPPAGTPLYVYTGDTQVFDLNPSSGYEVDMDATRNDGVTDCPGVTFSGNHNNTLTVGPILASCGIEVHFAALPDYPVTASATGNGTIDPSGTTSVEKWSTKSYTLDPDDGYVVSSVDGTCPQGSLTDEGDGTYTYVTGEIEGECTVVANFSTVPTTYTLTVTVIGDGGVYTGERGVFNPGTDIFCLEGYPDGCVHDFDYGTTVSLYSESPLPGITFNLLGWSGCTSESGGDCIVEMTGNKNVTATFSGN